MQAACHNWGVCHAHGILFAAVARILLAAADRIRSVAAHTLFAAAARHGSAAGCYCTILGLHLYFDVDIVVDVHFDSAVRPLLSRSANSYPRCFLQNFVRNFDKTFVVLPFFELCAL